MAKKKFKCNCVVCGKKATAIVDDQDPKVKNASSMADELQNGWLSLWICSKKCQKEHEAK